MEDERSGNTDWGVPGMWRMADEIILGIAQGKKKSQAMDPSENMDI